MSDERVVPGETHIVNVCKHIARYNLALPYCEGRDVLDIACGSGYGSWLISEVATSVTGVDIDASAIRHAQKHYDKDTITYKQSQLYEFSGSYSTVVSFETIEHIDNLTLTQEHLSSLLEKDGLLVFSVPLNERPGQNEHHKHVFTLESARSLFADLARLQEYIQVGVNFYHPQQIQPAPFQYYIAVLQK